MEIIAKKNEHFNIVATYILENDKVIRPAISLIPKGLFENTSTFDDVLANGDLVDRVKFMKVEAETVEELETILDLEETKILKQINKELNK